MSEEVDVKSESKSFASRYKLSATKFPRAGPSKQQILSINAYKENLRIESATQKVPVSLNHILGSKTSTGTP